MTKGKLVIYTDGSCHNASNNRGGYGIYMKWGEWEQKISGGSFKNTTNNRMELLAVIVALESIHPGFKTEIISDSQYVINSINKRWMYNWQRSGFKGRKNADLWERLIDVMENFKDTDITFTWTRGHVGTLGNEIADRLAGEGGAKEETIIDLGSGI